MSAFGSTPFIPGNSIKVAGDTYQSTRDQYGNIINTPQLTDIKNIAAITEELINNGINSGNLTPSSVSVRGNITSFVTVSDVTSTTGTTLTAAQFSGIIVRSGPTAAYSDTTPTAAEIVASIATPANGLAYFLVIENTVAFAATVVAGTGVTLVGSTGIAASFTRLYLVTITNASSGSEAVTLQGLMQGAN